jgi:HSP20 family protein
MCCAADFARRCATIFPIWCDTTRTIFPSGLGHPGAKLRSFRNLSSEPWWSAVCNKRRTNSTTHTQGEHSIMRLVRYTYPSFRSLVPTGFQRSPWSGLETEIDRLFETALGDYSNGTSSTRFPVDLYEDKDHTYVRAELPGLTREDINVDMTDGYLTIAATRKTPASEGEGEESYSFSRTVTVADEVQADKVSANYENGVLTVTLPKREETKPKKISVAVK